MSRKKVLLLVTGLFGALAIAAAGCGGGNEGGGGPQPDCAAGGIAISTGVIDYLKLHDAGAFRVSVAGSGGTPLSGELEIL